MVDYPVRVIVDPTNAELGLQRVNSSLNRTQRIAKRLSRSMLTLFAPLAAGALLVGITRTLASFSQEMSTVKAITGATETEFAQLRETARDLGATTRFSATQAAEGMTFLARAGFDTGEVLESVGDTLLLAQAGALGLGSAADIASNVLQGFRLETDQTGRVVDVLAFTAANANTNVTQLGDAMKFVAPVAAGLKVALETSAAAMGVLSNAGLQASLAGTGMRRVLSELESPTTNTSNLLRGLGLTTDDVRISQVGLIKAMENLKAAGVDTGLALEIFGDRGGPAFEVLSAAIPEIIRLEKELNNAEGTAKSIAEEMDDNLNGALLNLKSKFEELFLAIGDFGAEDFLLNAVNNLSLALVALADNLDIVAAAMVALAVRALLPLAITYLPAVTVAVSSLVAGFQVLTVAGGVAFATMTIAATAMRAAFAFITGPLGIGLTLISAIVGVLSFAFFRTKDAALEATKETVSYSQALITLTNSLAPASESLDDYTKRIKIATQATRDLEEQQLELSKTQFNKVLENLNKTAGSTVQTLIPLNQDMRVLQDNFRELSRTGGDLSQPIQEYIGVLEDLIAANPSREEFIGPVIEELRQIFIDLGNSSTNLERVEERLLALANAGDPVVETIEKLSQVARDYVLEISNENDVLALSTRLLIENNQHRASQIRILQIEQELGRALTKTERDALVPLVLSNEAFQRRKDLLEDLVGPQQELQQHIRDIIPLLGQNVELDKLLNQELKETAERLNAINLSNGEGSLADNMISEFQKIIDYGATWKDEMGAILMEPINSLIGGIGDATAKAIVFGDSFKESMRAVGQEILVTVISSLVQLGIKMALNAVLGQTLAAATTAAAVAEAAAVSAAWAPAAAGASLATLGTNAAPAIAGLTTTYATAGTLSAIPGYAEGGEFIVGGKSGRDANIVPLRLTRDEHVKIQTPAQRKKSESKGNVTYMMDFRGAERGVEERVKEVIGELLPDAFEANNIEMEENIMDLFTRERL